MDHTTFTATGSGSQGAYGVLEDAYEEGLSKEDAIELAVRAAQSASERDTASGDSINVVTISEDGGFQEIDDSTVEQYLK
jgi:proteasome beta subunit